MILAMNTQANAIPGRNGIVLLLWGLIALYSAARVLQVYPVRVPMLAVVALHVVPLAVFALFHGAMIYRLRDILVFLAICLVIGNIFENVGVRTGFPYGHYYFTDLMGPRLFGVPILLGLAYVGMGYLSWTLGSLILGGTVPVAGSRVVTLPLVAAFVMVAWDLSQDPVWSTIVRAWVWLHGGAYFGVPASNFLGWYVTVYIIYQSFALYLRGRSIGSDPVAGNYWHLAVLLYGTSAVGNVLLVIPRAGLSVVSDPSGKQWNVSDITGTCALISIFTMGAFALLAWVRLADRKSES